MTKGFLSEDFLLDNDTACYLYHEHAKKMPIYDFHSHLPVAEIATDRLYENLTQIWLYGDHYKWRAMRANGVAEKYISGEATDHEKFLKWADTMPFCIRNPLYHWTHLELKRYFGIGKLLSRETAEEIYEKCSQILQTKEYSVKNLLRKMNVKLVCTTEDPLDNLEHYRSIKKSDFEIAVHTTFRPDKAMASENVNALNRWIDSLQQATNINIKDFNSYLEALHNRHDYFHSNGCRLSDHGLGRPYAEDYMQKEIENIFLLIRKGKEPNFSEQAKFKSAVIYELAIMNFEKGWVQQLHIGALRNNNSRMYEQSVPDMGFDSIGDPEIAVPLSKFLDRLDKNKKLAKTILYNINPRDNELVATMIGNFQDGSVPGKMQFGPSWWFLDQKDGIKNQLNVLSSMGLLSRFIGMTTDSRSFLSFTRHEYFRRILCNILGTEMENGLIPNDMNFIGGVIQDICCYNAKRYFDFK
jgi:glucuronate isomerase